MGSQLFTETAPFSHLSEAAYLVQVVGTGLEPEWPGEEVKARGLTEDIWQLMRNCWRRNPALRMLMEALHSELAGLVEFAELATGSIAEFHFHNFEKRGTIRNFGKDISKGGWFDNIWNVDLTVLPGGGGGRWLPGWFYRLRLGEPIGMRIRIGFESTYCEDFKDWTRRNSCKFPQQGPFRSQLYLYPSL